MTRIALVRVLVIIIIIIGGVIIIIIRGPRPPEPECTVCGNNLVTMLGATQVLFGAVSLVLMSKINSATKDFRG